MVLCSSVGKSIALVTSGLCIWFPLGDYQIRAVGLSISKRYFNKWDDSHINSNVSIYFISVVSKLFHPGPPPIIGEHLRREHFEGLKLFPAVLYIIHFVMGCRAKFTVLKCISCNSTHPALLDVSSVCTVDHSLAYSCHLMHAIHLQQAKPEPAWMPNPLTQSMHVWNDKHRSVGWSRKPISGDQAPDTPVLLGTRERSNRVFSD